MSRTNPLGVPLRVSASAVAIAAIPLILVSSSAAHADDPAIPIRELPPFPEVEASARVSEVSVYGASQSEEETVVGAAKREQSLGTVASAVTVLTSDHLRRYGYRSLADALRGAAGVFIVDDRQVERIGVRGVQLLGDSNTRILILIDGTPGPHSMSRGRSSSMVRPHCR
jgi:outer membrane receptor protein involved in Fe transport